MNTRAERILAVAREVLALEERLRMERRELEGLLGAAEATPAAEPRRRYVPRGGLKARVLSVLQGQAPLRAIEVAEQMRPGSSGSGAEEFKFRTVVQTTLCKMAADGLVERVGRGMYQAPGGITQPHAEQGEGDAGDAGGPAAGPREER